ncbi:MAG TPA: ABC transporter substrate-binding protein [Pseudolabrys sp.]|jgi:branched-chain amino acid transport system substrate-binding protein|nr:ABC transporter substrate-binding protein [Pseudolabrys sp.]
MKKIVGVSVVAIALAFAGGAMAQENVKVGGLFPLSGNAASAGAQAKAAIELAVDIVNGKYPDVKGMPAVGLPGLKGGKIELTFADHQGNPSTGQSQALRLIQQEKVSALIGAYQSSVTFAGTQVAERYGVPWVVGDSVAGNITGRGFKFTFRVTPIASDFAYNYMDFLNDVKKMGHPVKTVATVYENTDYGTSIAATLKTAIKEKGFDLIAEIPYAANTTDVSSQVLQLKDKKPDAVIFVSYTSDTILYMKTLKQLEYKPPIVIGDDSGFSDPAFIKNVGNISQGAVNRSAWDIGKPGSVTAKINELFKAKTGYDMDDTSGRNMEAMFVLADAINRAGSGKPEAIQAALQKTDLKPEQLMMGFKGVKFDATGQNTLAATYLIQLQGANYVAVWPAKSATAKLQIPFKGSE